MSMRDIVIGAGPSGIMAALALKEIGDDVMILEANEKICKKLYITGKGRCNVTNNTDREGIIKNIVTNPKFLYSSISYFSPQDTISFFEDKGVSLKTERGNRVFPVSDKSSDIIKVFDKVLKQQNIKVVLNSKVTYVKLLNDNRFEVATDNDKYTCDKLIIATGGKSYPGTGSKGDGYKFASMLGHNIVQPRPALVPIRLKNYDNSISGLSLKNVACKFVYDNKTYEEFGEMLFTHNGLSGPIVLSLSSRINKLDIENKKIYIDLKPALTVEQVENRLLRDFDNYKNKDIKNYLPELMPKSLIETFLKQLSFNNKKVNEITKENRQEMVTKLKALEFTIDKLEDISVGIVTAGGVDVSQINNKNMESKLVSNLYFVGEVLDVDALTGGFNIQIAMSTGYSVGKLY